MNSISVSCVLSHSFYPVMKEVFKHIEAKDLVNCYFVSEEFRHYAQGRLFGLSEEEWFKISASLRLSEDFIRVFKDYVDWDIVSCMQNLSENFIRQFKNYVDWERISATQKLSEDFIREFKDKVNWINVMKYQDFSDKMCDMSENEFNDAVTKNEEEIRFAY